ncbi:hypothetical protein MUP77_01230 [Candidatus Bathyarchaeota archaeon]|nr:hypothetical protein [Candidatus Bathyarchaeota archaeon]
MILSGEKTWEIGTKRTSVRENRQYSAR